MNMTAIERATLAEQLGISDAYLYQCLTGRKAMNPEEAVRIEVESGRVLRRWQLRQADWHRIWPELIGIEGAPDVSDQADPTRTDSARPQSLSLTAAAAEIHQHEPAARRPKPLPAVGLAARND